MLDSDAVARVNEEHLEWHRRAFGFSSDQLAGRRIDVNTVLAELALFEVAIPSWALGTGGTRFGRFPGLGEPRNVFEKIEDISVIQQLTRSAPRVSLHIPWDEPEDTQALLDLGLEKGLGFDAVNSNSFQDQAGQPLSYKFGSLSHTDSAVRQQAIEHNLHVMKLGEKLGADAITIWLADGSNFPGQSHLRRSYERTLKSLEKIYRALPAGWKLFTEHKPYEPAFYSTVVQDWGTSLMLAQSLGDQAACLVDLGHHLPKCNIEQIVARLITAGKLGGFHFNDSKYGDDDLTTGSIHPYQLFLVFNELVDAANELGESFKPAYMIDQSHNLKDPIEALLQSVMALQTACAKALLIDRDALEGYQASNDVLMAEEALKEAFETDVSAVVAEMRFRSGGALNPIAAFRESGYRQEKSTLRAALNYVPPQSL